MAAAGSGEAVKVKNTASDVADLSHSEEHGHSERTLAVNAFVQRHPCFVLSFFLTSWREQQRFSTVWVLVKE